MADSIATALLVLAAAFTLILNVCLIVVIVRRKRLRTPITFPASILYITLACVDIFAVLLWTLPTASVAVTGNHWISDALNGKFCKAQVFVMNFCNLMNGYIYAAMMFERFLRFFKPSKQKEIFFDFVVLIFVASLTVFHTVIAAFPTWGFGQVAYFEDQYQCAVDYPWSESHFKFTMAMQFGLPLMLALTFYIAVLVRLCMLKKRRAPNGDMVVEEDLTVVGDSYSDRLKEIYARFKGAGSKSVKPKVKDEKAGYNHDGYHSDEDDVSYSDEEDGTTDKAVDDYPTLQAKKQRKSYYISRNDLFTAHMYFMMTLTYYACWMPYIVVIIIYTYYFYDIPVSKEFTLVAVILSHMSACLKLPWYFVSGKMRPAIIKTFVCCKTKRTKPFDAPHAVEKEQTTEL